MGVLAIYLYVQSNMIYFERGKSWDFHGLEEFALII